MNKFIISLFLLLHILALAFADDVTTSESAETTEKPCNHGDGYAVGCKECNCVHGKYDCHQIEGCEAPMIRTIHTSLCLEGNTRYEGCKKCTCISGKENCVELRDCEWNGPRPTSVAGKDEETTENTPSE